MLTLAWAYMYEANQHDNGRTASREWDVLALEKTSIRKEKKEPHEIIASRKCAFCDEVETEHHLFVERKHFDTRSKTSKAINGKRKRKEKKKVKKAEEDQELALEEHQLVLLYYTAAQTLIDAWWMTNAGRGWA